MGGEKGGGGGEKVEEEEEEEEKVDEEEEEEKEEDPSKDFCNSQKSDSGRLADLLMTLSNHAEEYHVFVGDAL